MGDENSINTHLPLHLYVNTYVENIDGFYPLFVTQCNLKKTECSVHVAYIGMAFATGFQFIP
ncbi:hypothetical protein [Bartonella vinsonii]|uniref:Uncharacterized protein n=1 Tax=Bartonella vinsonii TaxID=33047 RepID=A0A3S5C0M6_BARVI|nr:hypothetical protein [Bartonella vinsonii]VEJ45561.1 Uncharacterised protein [Bartonella vinsonii]